MPKGGKREGAGRKLRSTTITTNHSIKFTDDEWQTVQTKAKANNTTASDYIRKKALEEMKMTKEELVKAVLDNPEPACSAHKGLLCYGGYGSGEGQLKYEGRWRFVPFSATDRGFEPTDEFVKEVIENNWTKLRRYYIAKG